MIGQFIDGYQIVQSLGRGHAATVYTARQHPVERYVALKVFDDSTATDSLKRLGALLATFDHTHVLPVYASGETQGQAFWVMRYMPAGSLAAKLGAHRFTVEEIDRFMAQVASALDYVEQHGLAHGNLTPSNILLDHSGNAFVMDVGLEPQPSDYQAPELARTKSPDSRSDVYGLGAIITEMVTGRVPIDHRVPTSQAGKKIPPAVEAVLTKALAADPSQRYATPLEFAAAFTSAYSHARTPQLTVAPIPAGEGAIEVRRIHPRRSGLSWGWIAAGAIGLALIAGLIALAGRAPASAPLASPSPIDTLAPTATLRSTLLVIDVTPTQAPPPASTTTRAPTSLPTATMAPTLVTTPTIAATATRTLAPTPRVPRPTATPTITVETFALMIPRFEDRSVLSLSFGTYVRPDNISPVGTLSMSVPAVEPYVTSRDLADVGAGNQVLRVGVHIDCNKAVGPLISDRVVITLRTPAGAVLATQSFEYIKRWCE